MIAKPHRKTVGVKPTPQKSASKAPRYVQIAAQLRAAIAAGRYPIGAQLPTEHELCVTLSVSRFTIREAIRLLAGAGLVHRKPRAGTTVAALPDDTRFTQGITSLNDLAQYVERTDFRYVYIGRVGLSRSQARAISAKAGEEWTLAVALRFEKDNDLPFGLTRLYLNPALKGIEKSLRKIRRPVYSIIEREFGIRIDRVEQTIVAITLDEHDAHNLGVTPGSAGLLVTRSYFDNQGRLMELAQNVHPADRFTYRIALKR